MAQVPPLLLMAKPLFLSSPALISMRVAARVVGKSLETYPSSRAVPKARSFGNGNVRSRTQICFQIAFILVFIKEIQFCWVSFAFPKRLSSPAIPSRVGLRPEIVARSHSLRSLALRPPISPFPDCPVWPSYGKITAKDTQQSKYVYSIKRYLYECKKL